VCCSGARDVVSRCLRRSLVPWVRWMSGDFLRESSDTAAPQDHEEEQAHGGAARLVPAAMAAVDVGPHVEEEATVPPAQPPPSGRKSLSPWGSHEMEFDETGRDSSRRGPQVPTLGPLSYSVPVTPRGRHGHRTSALDRGAADLASDGAEGWSVPPMPYEDVVGSAVRIQQSQSFEQQVNDIFSSTVAISAATPARRGVFLGDGVRSGGSGRTMRAGLLPSPRKVAAAVAAAVEEDDVWERSAAEAEAEAEAAHMEWEGGGPQRGAERTGGRDDTREEEEEEEEEEECYERETEEAGAQGTEASAGKAVTALLLPPQLRQPLHSPLSSPPQPPPPSAALAFTPVAATNSERPAMFEGRPGLERLAGGVEATKRGSAATTPRTKPESVLKRMAEACRRAGVVFDPSLEDEIKHVLACGASSSSLVPPPSAPSPHAALAEPPSPPFPSIPPSLSTEAVAAAVLAPAKTLGARADNPWGWAAPLDDHDHDDHDDGATAGGGIEGGGPSTVSDGPPGGATPPSRDRSWTVPSPYRHLDDKPLSASCIPDFRLDDGIGGGSGRGGELGSGRVAAAADGETWRACSCSSDDDDASRAPSDAAARTAGKISRACAEAEAHAAEPPPPPPAVAAESAAAFLSSLQDRAGDGGHEDLQDDGHHGGVYTLVPKETGDWSSQGEREGPPSDGLEEGSTGDIEAGNRGWEAVPGEERETGGRPSLPSPVRQSQEQQCNVREEMELAAAIAEVRLEGGGEGGSGGGGGAGGHAEEEEERRVASFLGMGRFEVGVGGGHAEDEWVDDLDPGFMVMAASEQELHHGQPHSRAKEVAVHAADNGPGGDVDAPPKELFEAGEEEDTTAAVSGGCAPSHESSDYGGGGGGGGGGGVGADVGSGESRRRSWAGRSMDEFDWEEEEGRPRQTRASSDEGRASRDRLLVADGVGGSGEIERAGGGDYGYGEGDLYERDLEDAVALLENGGFAPNRNQPEAWRSESFSSSTGGDGGGGGGGGGGGEEGEQYDAAAVQDEEEERGGEPAAEAAAVGRDDDEGRLLDIAHGMTITKGRVEVAAATVADSSGGVGGGSGNVRSSSSNGSRRQFFDGGYDDDGRGRGGGESAGCGDATEGCGGGGGGESVESRPSSRRKDSFVFSETSAGSAGAGERGAGAAEGGAPGK
ncbi:unnamed protein product, partial [Ectocarpus sp. 13 AM-2016]